MKNHLSEALRGAYFFAMPGIEYDVLFSRQSLKNDCVIVDKLVKAPFKLLRCAFFPKFDHMDFDTKEDSKILFYLSDPTRKSNEVDFKKAVDSAPLADILIERYNNGIFSILGFYLFFLLVPIWSFQLKGRGLSIIEKFQVLEGLLETYRASRFFRSIDIKKYNLLVCFYDSIIHECMLTLLFKKSKVKTATLQHGQFTSWRENTFVNCGLELMSSASDYQLCWNYFARDEAVKSGWHEGQLPVLGIISNIGRSRQKWKKPNNGIFGVVISHPSWENENIEMIKAANILSEKYNLTYYLKLHPHYKEDYFINYINSKCVGNIQKGIDTLIYCNMVDFSIVGSSSFYAEMVYFYHDVLKYSSGLPSDKYYGLSNDCSFSNAEQICEVYDNMAESNKQALFDYLCVTDQTESLYRAFFNKFANKDVDVVL